MQYTKNSISHRITRTIVLIALVPILIVATIFTWFSRRSYAQTLDDALEAVAGRQADSMGQTLNAHLDLLVGLGEEDVILNAVVDRNQSYGEMTQQELFEVIQSKEQQWQTVPDNDPFIRTLLVRPASVELNAFRIEFRDYGTILVTDIHGGLVASTVQTNDYYFGDEAWWKAAYNSGGGASYISPFIVYDEESDTEGLLIAVPIINNEGRLAGVLRATYKLNSIAKSFESAKFGDTGHVLIVDPLGNVVFDPTQSTQLDHMPLPEATQLYTSTQTNGVNQIEGQQGETIIAASSRIISPRIVNSINSLNWHTVAVQPRKEAFRPINRTTLLLLALTVSTLTVALLIAYYTVRSITQPLSELSDAARQLAREKKFSVRVHVYTDDEFGEVAGAFNSMAGEIEDLVDNLEQTVEKRTAELAERVRELTKLRETGVKLSRHQTTPEKASAAIVDGIVEVFNPDLAGIYIWDSEHQGLKLQRFYSAANMEAPNGIASASGVNTTAFQTLQLEFIDNYPDWPNRNEEWVKRFGVKAMMSTPLLWQGQAIGTLFLGLSEKREFAAGTRRLLSLFAQQAAATAANASLLNRAEMAQAEAEEANRVKSRFLANMSHEIRTPLNLIMGFSEVMLRSPETYGGDWSPLLRRDLSHIYRNSKHLLMLTNNLLEIARADIMAFSVNKEEVSLEPLLEDVGEMALSLFHDKPIEFCLDVPEELPVANVDPTRIRQVILNLLSNAQRFTHQGEVTLSASCTISEVVISVKDTGVGIPESQQEYIFNEFFQIDTSLRRAHEGVGLGLAISKRFVEAHNGRIWFESEEGVGTTFYFSIPLRSVDDVSQSYMERSATTEQETRVVVSSNDGRVMPVLMNLLPDVKLIYANQNNLGPTIQAYSPRYVIQIANSHMDDSPAIEFGGTVITFPELNKDWLTMQLETSAQLTKPVQPEDLIKCITQFSQGNRILIIDNDRGFCHLVNRILQSIDGSYELQIAFDSHKGLEVLGSRQPPDLILLDQTTYQQGNVDLLAIARASRYLNAVPIILLATLQNLPDEQEDPLEMIIRLPRYLGPEKTLDYMGRLTLAAARTLDL